MILLFFRIWTIRERRIHIGHSCIWKTLVQTTHKIEPWKKFLQKKRPLASTQQMTNECRIRLMQSLDSPRPRHIVIHTRPFVLPLQRIRYKRFCHTTFISTVYILAYDYKQSNRTPTVLIAFGNTFLGIELHCHSCMLHCNSFCNSRRVLCYYR